MITREFAIDTSHYNIYYRVPIIIGTIIIGDIARCYIYSVYSRMRIIFVSLRVIIA